MKTGAEKWFSFSFQIEGLSLERLMNLAREQGIILRKLRRRGLKTLEGICLEADFRHLSELAENRGWKIIKTGEKGLSRAKSGLFRRLGLGVGFCLFIALVALAMQFVWQIDIMEAGAYESEVRNYLVEQNIQPGIWKRDISLQKVIWDLEWRMPKVAWVQAHYRGAVLVIRCVQGVSQSQGESEGGPGDVVAQRDGILVNLLTLAGTPQHKAGDLVKKGEILIAGWERGIGEEKVPVKARGIALARVWVRTSVQIPAQEVLSEETGRETVLHILETPFISIGEREPPAYLQSDLQIDIIPIGGAWWPIYLRRETWREVALSYNSRNESDLKAEAGLAALRALAQKLGGGHEPVDKWVDYCMIERRMMEAVATAELLVDIALQQPREQGSS